MARANPRVLRGEDPLDQPLLRLSAKHDLSPRDACWNPLVIGGFRCGKTRGPAPRSTHPQNL